MQERLSRREGTTLAETLVAVTVLTIAMGFLVEFTAEGFTQSVLTRRRIRGNLLAQEKMEEVLRARDRGSLPAWETTAKTTYQRDPEGEHYLFNSTDLEDFRWDWDLNEVDGRPRMREIIVRVYWRFHRDQGFREGCVLRSLLTTASSSGKGGPG